MIEIRWHGRGGQGSFTAARLLGLSAALFENKYALAFPSFGPERRGAPVLGFTRIDDNKITDRSDVIECDYVVVLDETLIDSRTTHGLKKNGYMIINSNKVEKYDSLLKDIPHVCLDGTALALDILKRPITNTAMLGALLAVSNIISLDSAVKGIEYEMPASIAPKNIQLLETSYKTMKERLQ